MHCVHCLLHRYVVVVILIVFQYWYLLSTWLEKYTKSQLNLNLIGRQLSFITGCKFIVYIYNDFIHWMGWCLSNLCRNDKLMNKSVIHTELVIISREAKWWKSLSNVSFWIERTDIFKNIHISDNTLFKNCDVFKNSSLTI